LDKNKGPQLLLGAFALVRPAGRIHIVGVQVPYTPGTGEVLAERQGCLDRMAEVSRGHSSSVRDEGLNDEKE
jgi:hypothetical protein